MLALLATHILRFFRGYRDKSQEHGRGEREHIMAKVEACLVRKGDFLDHRGGCFMVRQVRHCLLVGVTLWATPVCARAREAAPSGMEIIAVRPTTLLTRLEDKDGEEQVQAA